MWDVALHERTAMMIAITVAQNVHGRPTCYTHTAPPVRAKLVVILAGWCSMTHAKSPGFSPSFCSPHVRTSGFLFIYVVSHYLPASLCRG